MRRILFVDLSPRFGGAQRSLLTLLRELDQEIIQPFVLSADTTASGLLVHCEKLGMTVGPIRAATWGRNLVGLIKFIINAPPAIMRVRQWVKAHEIDLIHANGIRSGLILSCAVGGRVPVVFHHRDWRCPASILRYVVRRSRKTITVSNALQKHTANVVGEMLASRLVTVYNGVDVPRSSGDGAGGAVRRDLGIDETALLIGLVADMTAWKRHLLFLQALAQMQTTQQNVAGLVVGGAFDSASRRYAARLRAKAEMLGLADKVFFTGHVDDALPLIAATDIMVSVAENEPFGRTIVEALALGRPVIVTGGGGAEEIIGGCAAVEVVDDTPDALARALTDWNADRRRCVQAADEARRCAERYTPKQHAAAVQDLFNQLVSG